MQQREAEGYELLRMTPTFKKAGALLGLLLQCWFTLSAGHYSPDDLRSHLASKKSSSSSSSYSSVNSTDLWLVDFYGKIMNNCEVDDCFQAVVSSGRTNFGIWPEGRDTGGDLANIYVQSNSYDTWRQHTNSSAPEPTTGEFVYQLSNGSLSCMTLQLSWEFQVMQDIKLPAPIVTYSCSAVPLAANWDCHLDWAIVAECSYNATLNQVSALYTVTNLGHSDDDFSLSSSGEASSADNGGIVVVQDQGRGASPHVGTFFPPPRT